MTLRWKVLDMEVDTVGFIFLRVDDEDGKGMRDCNVEMFYQTFGTL